MTNQVNVPANDFGNYFREINLEGRVSVLESAKTLLKVQQEDMAVLADAPMPPMEAEKELA
ncbi:MAG: hypothetical protein LBD48_05240 [Treponema sp.]|jgi:hypothetical protein|nr:hypothetical protein [Treponema sp.]